MKVKKNKGGGTGAVDSVNTKTGVVTLNQDEIPDGTTYKQYSATEKAKVGVITTSGDGSQYLANDGTYKTVGSGGSVAFADITSKPTTVTGYGITNAVDTSTSQAISGNKTFNGATALVGPIITGSGANIISGYKPNFYGGTSAASMSKWTNSVTGQTATDGFDIGITADGTAEIRQRENLPLNIYTNNALAAIFGADKSLTLPSLAGAGNRTLMVDSTGMIYAV